MWLPRPYAFTRRRAHLVAAHRRGPAPLPARGPAPYRLRARCERVGSLLKRSNKRSRPCPKAVRLPPTTGAACRVPGGHCGPRIAELERVRDRLDTCIGCGCLSLGVCRLLNPNDVAGAEGADHVGCLTSRTDAGALKGRHRWSSARTTGVPQHFGPPGLTPGTKVRASGTACNRAGTPGGRAPRKGSAPRTGVATTRSKISAPTSSNEPRLGGCARHRRPYRLTSAGKCPGWHRP